MSTHPAHAPTRHDELQRAAREHLLLHLAPNGAYAGGDRELLVLDRAEGVHVVDTAGQRLAHQVA
jgi:hypothetical protein